MIGGAPEFSRPLPFDRLGRSGEEVEVVANEAERAALAARFGLPTVLALACRFRLGAPEASGIVPAHGRLAARVVQVCVVTLDEFEAEVAEEFAVRFVPEALLGAEVDLEGDDEIPYAGALDLGEAAAEQLALALDPYPHKPGVAAPEAAEGEAEERSPFAALAKRRRPH